MVEGVEFEKRWGDRRGETAAEISVSFHILRSIGVQYKFFVLGENMDSLSQQVFFKFEESSSEEDLEEEGMFRSLALDDPEKYKKYRITFLHSTCEDIIIEEHFVSAMGIYSIKIFFGAQCALQLCYYSKKSSAFQIIASNGETNWRIPEMDWVKIVCWRHSFMRLCRREERDFFSKGRQRNRIFNRSFQSLRIGSCLCSRNFAYRWNSRSERENMNFDIKWRDAIKGTVRFGFMDKEEAIAFGEFIPVFNAFKLRYPTLENYESGTGVEIERYL